MPHTEDQNEALAAALRAIEIEDPCEPGKKVSPDVFERDGGVYVSAEDDGHFCYYFAPGGAWVHPQLQQFARERNLFWEWENAACIRLYPV